MLRDEDEADDAAPPPDERTRSRHVVQGHFTPHWPDGAARPAPGALRGEGTRRGRGEPPRVAPTRKIGAESTAPIAKREMDLMAVRLGFVGTGGIANRHLTCAQKSPDMEIVGACDVVLERAQEAAAKYGGNAYANFVEMYDTEKPDAIVVCTPPFAHGDIEEEAAKRGIHIFVEKPVAVNMEIAKRVLDAVWKYDVITQVGYMPASPLDHHGPGDARRMRYRDGAGTTMRSAQQKLVDQTELGGGQLVEQATYARPRASLRRVRSVIGKVATVHDWTPPPITRNRRAGWSRSRRASRSRYHHADPQ